MARKSQMYFVGDLVETKEGPVKVTSYTNSRNMEILFLNTGYVTTVRASNLKSGFIKDLLRPRFYEKGFLGVGPHKTGFMENGKGKNFPVYNLWRNMLQRCYDPKLHKTHPTYIGCEVDSFWLNYQNFCNTIETLPGYQQWADYQMGTSEVEYQLDKDKIVTDNKTYSLETCCFLTAVENMSLGATKRHRRNRE